MAQQPQGALTVIPAAGNGAVVASGSTASVEALQRMKRAMLQKMGKVSNIADAAIRVSSEQITLPLLILGVSKVDATAGISKMIYTRLPDLKEMRKVIRAMPDVNANGEIVCEVDIRGKDLRERDEKIPNFDLAKEPVHSATDVAGMVDPEGRIRRVNFVFRSFDFLSFRNDAKVAAIKEGSFAIVNLEASGWHDEDEDLVKKQKLRRIIISPKITGFVEQIPIPSSLFVDFVYRSGLWTRNFKTKVRYYMSFMDKVHRGIIAASDEEINAQRYRNDNQFIFLLFPEEEFPLEVFNEREGCLIRDVTDVKKEANLYDTRKDTVRYFATYQGRQWTTSPVGVRTEMDFALDVAFFNIMERFGISAPSIWREAVGTLRKYFSLIVYGCEECERTMKTKASSTRIYETDPDDPESINKPTTDGTLSFGMTAQVRSVVLDAPETIRRVSIPVRPQTVIDAFWNGKKFPLTLPLKTKILQNTDPRLVNLSESSIERRELMSPDTDLRIFVNINVMDARDGTSQPLSVLGSLSLDEGDSLARFLATCVLGGQGLNESKQDYLAMLAQENPEAFAKITPDSAINRYIFTRPDSVITIVYALNRTMIDEEQRIFREKISRLNFGSVFKTIVPLKAIEAPRQQPALPPAPAPAPAPAPVPQPVVGVMTRGGYKRHRSESESESASVDEEHGRKRSRRTRKPAPEEQVPPPPPIVEEPEPMDEEGEDDGRVAF